MAVAGRTTKTAMKSSSKATSTTLYYVIVSGQALVTKGDEELKTLAEGDCFGEMGYLARTKRSASLLLRQECLAACHSTVIGQVSLNCQVRVLKVFLRTLIYRLSITSEKMSQAGLLSRIRS